MTPLDANRSTTPNPPPKRSKRVIKRGRQKTADRIFLYGVEKIGKSTFAAGAPGAMWLGADDGTAHLDIARWPDELRTWEDVLAALDAMFEEREEHGIETVVIDPLNWFETNFLEPWAAAKTKGSTNKFAKFDVMLEQWRVFRDRLKRFWEAGVNIILLAHAKVKKFEDPESEGFERYQPDMQGKGPGLFMQWVDVILFAKKDTFARNLGGKIKGGGGDKVVMHTKGRAAFDAGNRWDLPEKLPLSWRALQESRAGVVADMTARIFALVDTLEGITNDGGERRTRVEGYLADPAVRVSEILNALEAKLEELRPGETETTTTETTEEKE